MRRPVRAILRVVGLQNHQHIFVRVHYNIVEIVCVEYCHIVYVLRKSVCMSIANYHFAPKIGGLRWLWRIRASFDTFRLRSYVFTCA